MKPRLGHLPPEAAPPSSLTTAGRAAPLRRALAAWTSAFCVAGSLLALPVAASGQLAPPSTGGAPRLDALLQRLAEPHRVLAIAAHPDDEDTGLLTLLARGHGVTVAYLSLSRGEGGQNLIGLQLGTDLGLLRTQELLAARAIDGGAQFFTRAYDFGFTRDLAETERAWTPDSILKDAVRVVRRFRPHVMVAGFSGTARDGHGQHQMAGIMARRAFAAAGNPAAFPELEREEGLRPWRPLKLYQSARFNRAAATLTLAEGGLDPATGRTFSQIAMASRSQHRSQDFGVLQRLGPGEVRLAVVEAGVPGSLDTSLFGGIAVPRSWLAGFADSLRRTLVPARLADAVPALAAAVTRARRDSTIDPDRVEGLHEALAVAAGVVVDARAGSERVVPGDSVRFEIEVYNAGAESVALDRAVVVTAAGPWRDSLALRADGTPEPGRLVTAGATVTAPRSAAPTQPYFLARPLAGALYDWSDTEPVWRGRAAEPPPFTAVVRLRIAGAAISLCREVTHRSQDQAIGEIRRPVRVAPRIEVTLDPDTIVWPATGPDSQMVTVTLRHHGAAALSGTVRLTADGWPAPPERAFRFPGAGGVTTMRISVGRPSGVTRADVTLRAEALTDAGERFARGAFEIAYPHIRPVTRLRAAESRVRVAPIALPPLRWVGYVRGASDRVPEALDGVGLPLVLLEGNELLRGDLSRYDAIVIGSRAFETDSALMRANDRLLAYVRNGGRLVVQYQQYAYVRGGYPPFPLTIAQPHDRITDETSPVTVLAPMHPALRVPNLIDAADFEGWPQERGLYFANTWDAAWTPLLELRDPGGDARRGGLLVARVGQGSYIYTGLSFFRALPAGVPGAFRLFLNLLAWDGSGE
jgi:LmbE family N-acetylglucosaminyl deacetylase